MLAPDAARNRAGNANGKFCNQFNNHYADEDPGIEIHLAIPHPAKADQKGSPVPGQLVLALRRLLPLALEVAMVLANKDLDGLLAGQ